jgi:hypothetical protein
VVLAADASIKYPSMAIFAAGLAMVTPMGHRLHTEEVVLRTKVADGCASHVVSLAGIVLRLFDTGRRT